MAVPGVLRRDRPAPVTGTYTTTPADRAPQCAPRCLNNVNTALFWISKHYAVDFPYVDALRQTSRVGHKRTFVSDELPQQVSSFARSFLA